MTDSEILRYVDGGLIVAFVAVVRIAHHFAWRRVEEKRLHRSLVRRSRRQTMAFYGNGRLPADAWDDDFQWEEAA